jgi:hypothetical protein
MADTGSMIDDFMSDIKKKDKDGIVTTVKEMKENQFGLPLEHYAQEYLFGATGLRLKVFHSIAGLPASCKSPLLFDLMGHICAPVENNGLGGIGFLYELEDKISPTLLEGVLSRFGDIKDKSLRIVRGCTIEEAMKHLTTKLLPSYKAHFTKYNIPLVVGMDSIGGAASKDTVNKIVSDGVAGKGFYDKAHYLKYFCENAGVIMGDIPMIVICINQEKEAAAATAYGPPVKKITGGASQLFKDGHMISAGYKTLASGDGKVITLRTTKTSFCDARKIEVTFRWNKFGSSEKDAYGHRFEWAMASAKVLADPEKGVGDLRDIADVKVSDGGLVTCPQLDCKSVPPEVFEAALYAPEYSHVLSALRVYQKIECIKSVADYEEYLKNSKKEAKDAAKEDKGEPKKSTVKRVSKKAAATATEEQASAPQQDAAEPEQNV